MALLELDEAIKPVVATLANIAELKPEQEECVKLFIEGKDVALVPTLFWEKPNISPWEKPNISPSNVSRKCSNPIVVNSDWLKSGPMVSE